MNTQPFLVIYDINKTFGVNNMVTVSNENNVDTRFLRVVLRDSGVNPVSQGCTATAAIVYTPFGSKTRYLLRDDEPCEIVNNGIIVPIDDVGRIGNADLLVELTVYDASGEKLLVTPYPIWVRVTASVLDDAEVTPESMGTVPELIEECTEALEQAKDYDNLTDKPQINGHELSGNQTSGELGLQGQLTASGFLSLNNDELAFNDKSFMVCRSELPKQDVSDNGVSGFTVIKSNELSGYTVDVDNGQLPEAAPGVFERMYNFAHDQAYDRYTKFDGKVFVRNYTRIGAFGVDWIHSQWMYQDISDKADKATTLSGYGITDAYTKEEVNSAIATAIGGIENGSY